MSLPIHSFTVSQREANDPRAARLLSDAHALGFTDLTGFDCQDLYFVEGELSSSDQQHLMNELFSDPVTQICHTHDQAAAGQVIEIALRPGVTDPIAEQIVRGAQLLGINSVTRAASGQRFVLRSKKSLSKDELQALATRLLANPVIHNFAIGTLAAVFPESATAANKPEFVAIRNLNDEQLLALSRDRRAALDLAEMQAVQKYYRDQQRDPTDVEFETIAQTWSEHCSHKTFRADIECEGKTIHGLLKTYIRAATEEINAPWVWSAFIDNAGIIEFDDEFQISFKVETHNHPSAIEPFGGANTGLGGVIRDILGVSAKPIAATDVFCFGPQTISINNLPEGTLHPRLIQSGVVAGVQDYGNKTGIPTVNGGVYYDAGYTANPLVYCGCVGLIPKNKHPRNPKANDRVIVLGGRTGRDGLRGATFSSLTMDAQTGEVAGASVQIGDPIIAKGLIEVVTRARDAQLYHAITDCGAGGLSSAVGEMASEIGADVDLVNVKLKYPGLTPWEIWLSEAQERMVMAVPAYNVPTLQMICDTFDIELTDIGQFTDTNELVVRYDQAIVLQLSNHFLHDGRPLKKLMAQMVPSPCKGEGEGGGDLNRRKESLFDQDYSATLLRLLSHPNTASKADIIRRYDHEVQGGTVIKPLTGICNDGPADACVLKPLETKGTRGIVLSNGMNPEIGKTDPYAMAVSVIDEAVRNAVAVGVDPDHLAILDNFCWGDPKRPETLGSLVAASQGCYDAAVHYRTPFISGKDSLNNEYLSQDGERHAIPGTLLISAIGVIPDVNKAVTLDLKKAGNVIYLLGEITDSLVLPKYAPALYRALHQAMQKSLVRACHDLSEGGLAVAIAEMCIAGRLGCEINVTTAELLFGESNGCLLVEVESSHCAAFENAFSSELRHLINPIGKVIDNKQLIIQQDNSKLVALPINELVKSFTQNHV
jgi:phosphoribosylformylglycinamidine synthase II